MMSSTLQSCWIQIQAGGPVLYGIAALSLVAWSLIMLEWFELRDAARSRRTPVRAYRQPISRLASLAPLLGLLGTVLGLMETFGVLQGPETIAGTSSVEMEGVALGVSRALLTTQAGLLVALPILLARSWLDSRVASCTTSRLEVH